MRIPGNIAGKVVPILFAICALASGNAAYAADAARAMKPYAETLQERKELEAKAGKLAQDQLTDCRERPAAGGPVMLAVMGLAFGNGYRVKQDPAQAYVCYSRAAEQGHAFSQNMAGSLLRDGIGIKQDLEKALFWFERCARQGNSNCVVNIGTVHDKRGDYETALSAFFEAGAVGHPVALYNIGYYHYAGKGPLEQDHREAFSCLLRAARLGYPPAQLAVAAAYANGDGVARDGDEAMKWLSECVQQGSAECREQLEQMRATAGPGRSSLPSPLGSP